MRAIGKARSSIAALALLVSCGRGGLGAGHGGAAGNGAVGGAGGTNSTTVRAGSGGAGGSGGRDSIPLGGSAGMVSTTTCTSMCYADFPCGDSGQDKPKCVTGQAKSIAVGREVSCQETCGTPCCSGGSCRVESDACPSDTVCVYPSGSSTAECVSISQACGGFLGNTCGANEYCELLGGQCNDGSANCPPLLNGCTYVRSGATGVCQRLPSDSECAKFTKPVCGCDGVTYKNDCARRAASVAIDYSGECRGGLGGVAGGGGRGGAGGVGGGAGGSGGANLDASPIPDAPLTNDFCVGQDSKLAFNAKTWTVAVTSKPTDLFMSCCMAYAARLHAQQFVGEDLDVVIKFNVGLLRAGTHALGTEQYLGASLRSSVRSLDGGTPEEAWVTGSLTVSGSPDDNNQAWQMGLCVSVDDPSSRWQGLRVYVPGVPVAPSAWANRFRMLRLKDSSLKATDVDQLDVNTLELAPEPLLNLMNVDFVQLDSTKCLLGGKCTWIGLDTEVMTGSTLLSTVKGTATLVDLRGVPFVVEADGQRIYLGAFETSISSIGIGGPGVMVEEIVNEGFPIYPPPSFRPLSPDLRNDPRIVKVFTEAGKVIP